jgi:hypothetical protein
MLFADVVDRNTDVDREFGSFRLEQFECVPDVLVLGAVGDDPDPAGPGDVVETTDQFPQVFPQKGLSPGQPQEGEAPQVPAKFFDFLQRQIVAGPEFVQVKAVRTTQVAARGDEIDQIAKRRRLGHFFRLYF